MGIEEIILETDSIHNRFKIEESIYQFFCGDEKQFFYSDGNVYEKQKDGVYRPYEKY